MSDTTKHWYESRGWKYHDKDCIAYGEKPLSCDCGLDVHLEMENAAQPATPDGEDGGGDE